MPRIIQELRIGLTEDGQIVVGGPIDDKILCYGMLESAKDAIRSHKDKAPAIRVPPPSAVDALVRPAAAANGRAG